MAYASRVRLARVRRGASVSRLALHDDLVTRLTRALAARVRRVRDCPDKTVAAVLVPLLLVEGDAHLLFTRRATTLPHHQGQVAFPGGTTHTGDADLTATALREAHEEVGLD